MFEIIVFCFGCADIIFGFLSKSTLLAIVGLILMVTGLLHDFIKPLTLKQIIRVLSTFICVATAFVMLFWGSLQPINDYFLAVIQLFLLPISFLFCDDDIESEE